MNVLLINANRFKQPWPVIPFGLCCVAASIEEAGHDVRVLDLCFSKKASRDIKQAIEGFQPDIVGVSIRNIDNSAGYNTLFLLDQTRDEVIEPLKAAFHGPIVIGGPSVGINGAEMLQYFDLPFAIRGDGETAMVEFLRRIENGQGLEGAGGLVRQENGQIVADNEPLRVPDLNELPLVRPHRYIDLKPYNRFDSPIQIQTKRGCALSCTYCTYNRIEGTRYRLRDPSRVADEIETLVTETGINHLEFTDSTFNVPLDHAKAVLRAVIAKGLDLRLRTMGLNPGAVDEELADLIHEAGFRDVDLGVEAGCDAMLQSLGKNFRKADVLRAGRLLRERKVPTTWYLLVGAPGESEATLRETFDTINTAASPWDLVNIGVGLRVYKGSPIAAAMRQGMPECTTDSFLHPVHVEPEQVSLEEIKAITKREALRHPNYFLYDEDETTPVPVLMTGALLLRMIAPRRPLWKLHILLRTLQQRLGIAGLKRLRFEKQLRAARLVQTPPASQGPTTEDRWNCGASKNPP
ncbi:MAG: radical SAM protein [Deferrisomatales bacterium]|nr:radical SAM protein [Deferrisomatales bacterium]